MTITFLNRYRIYDMLSAFYKTMAISCIISEIQQDIG